MVISKRTGPNEQTLETGTSIEELPELEIKHTEERSSDSMKEISCRRIVDITHLFESLKSLRHEEFGCSFFDIDIISEKRFGLRSVFNTKCKVCNIKETLSTERVDGEHVDINKAAVSGLFAVGGGYYQLTQFLDRLKYSFYGTKYLYKNCGYN
ncbi:hypothetical protein ILUMI_21390 [Ignelater luminosus]|uniref:Mutator-like transposase domain-containing protein n=1 Tax=Ignelater luminosus TaxID=2038154 RepID=A0A8K0CCJ4_IGNLU|nr:hypothetical protein ILUMI_21390 [Ignelater luminosus]